MPLSIVYLQPLTELFEALVANGDERWFHPHPLTEEEAENLCNYHGHNVYRVLTEDGLVLAYGMLRGFDEEYEVPSLGLAVHPQVRREGLGRMLMQELHKYARLRGARRVRLKVYPDNIAAIKLYESFGYEFEPEPEGEELVGIARI